MRIARTWWLALAAGAIVASASLAVGRHRGSLALDRTEPGSTGPLALGPSAETLAAAVDRRLLHAVETLSDPDVPIARRSASYRHDLQAAEELATRAVLANAVGASSIERLAAIRWERAVVEGTRDDPSVEALIEVAARRAGRVSGMRLALGKTLYKMGRTEEAGAFMAEAARLSRSSTRQVVSAMIEAGVPPDTIARTLARTPDVMIAVKDPYLDAGLGHAFLATVEERLDAAPPALLWSYGEACLQLRSPERLRASVEALPFTDDAATSAERARQRAYASAALGEISRALDEADEARRLRPDEPSFDELYGTMALTAGRTPDAEAAFRAALESAVRHGASRAIRARIYREIGQANESGGRGDLAVDAFRRALALDPTEAYALARLGALESAITGRGAP